MEKVQGIGGFFYRAKDPAKLSDWYAAHLGIDLSSGPWRQEAGACIFVPFPDRSDYFPTDRRWMINFRVDDLDRMIAQLEAEGIEVTTDPGWDSEVGRFARIHDPEGNPIELWEPSDLAR
ncbi:MAG: VOC family protein [Minwuia sp.]|uniref:VOC family protein n=1 Tax=Minwuia sp. TaxID=2493630 RepID=UPI003A87088A